MGVLSPGTGKLQSGSAGLDLRKATCGPVPTYHKPYKVAGPLVSAPIEQQSNRIAHLKFQELDLLQLQITASISNS
jgi:hypothetical protein